MRIRTLSLISLLFFLSQTTPAQEILTGTSYPAARPMKSTTSNAALPLPFFDDFSSLQGAPDPTLWADNEVFINTGFGYLPATTGVATLDAIDLTGTPHDNANVFPYESDHLTSRYIRLDSIFGSNPSALSPADSLYFSFYYQPQGYGDAPQPGDSLVLQFLAVGDNDTVIIEGNPNLNPPTEPDTIIHEGWHRVWSAAGQTLEEFHKTYGTYFRQVMIPLTDSLRYFNRQFRFRFVNYASLPDNTLMSWQSNVDQWNIDYIRLDRQRSFSDTTSRDIAFVSNAPSFLERYSAMPYWQYNARFIDEMALRFNNLIVNLDNQTRNASYVYNVYSESGNLIKQYDGGNYTLSPYSQSGYLDYPFFSNPAIILPFPVSPDSTTYSIEHILSTGSGLVHPENDTLRSIQKFADYYAYDDGTAEAGYALTPAGARLAYQFQLNDPDTIKAIRIYFNKTWKDANEQYFYLTIWDDNNGIPGNIVYQSSTGILPTFPENLHAFSTYELETPVVFEKKNQIFYVGWLQTTDDILNVGFDFSRNTQNRIFYNTGTIWQNSLFEGSLMIRPVLGVPDKESAQSPESSTQTLKTYPNPVKAQSYVTIDAQKDQTWNDADWIVRIYNAMGQLLYEGNYQDQLSVSQLDQGRYLLQLQNRTSRETRTTQFIKIR
jgi:hypothetical protein